jgi:hypothetical protein
LFQLLLNVYIFRTLHAISTVIKICLWCFLNYKGDFFIVRYIQVTSFWAFFVKFYQTTVTLVFLQFSNMFHFIYKNSLETSANQKVDFLVYENCIQTLGTMCCLTRHSRLWPYIYELSILAYHCISIWRLRMEIF